MNTYASGHGWELNLGDCEVWLSSLPDASVDAIVTDPPYELGFMGKKWDASGIANSVALWRQALRVMKPGAHLLAFGGTRTYHRMTCAIEDAGFEIRDSLHWMYGTGFPKSHDIAKAIDKTSGVAFAQEPASGVGFMGPDGPSGYNPTKHRLRRTGESTEAASQWQGWGTALKPGHEPIVLARKPLVGTVAQNVQAHGTGALNIDACRIETADCLDGGAYSSSVGLVSGAGFTIGRGLTREYIQPSGRWPANVLLDEAAASELDGQSGELTSGARASGVRKGIGFHGTREGDGGPAITASSGGASRFFYVAKASRSERDSAGRNIHPTVKPLRLMQYLVQLVTPPGGLVIDPFVGSGTTALAAITNGYRFKGCDLSAEYLDIAASRLEAMVTQGSLGLAPA